MDSKNPKAKPLPIAKMMVHHFLYFAPGRVDEAPGGCWSGAGFIGGRGEEHPLGAPAARHQPRLPRQVRHREPQAATASAPDWSLTAMVMNHYKKPEVRSTCARGSTTRPRSAPRCMPLVIGKCSQLSTACPTTCPAAARRARTSSTRATGSAPFNGRLLMAVLPPARRRQVPDARRASPASAACSRRPSTTRPRTTCTTRSARSCTSRDRSATAPTRPLQGIPISAGRGAAPHGRARQPQPARGLDGLLGHLVREGRLREAVRQAAQGHRRDQQAASATTSTPDYELKVPQLSKPSGAVRRLRRWRAERGRRLLPARADHLEGRPAGDVALRRARSRTRSPWPTARADSRPCTGARSAARYTVTPTVKGTYKLVCLVHPTTMAETLVVK